MPPFWLHHVTASSAVSVSVSVWSASVEGARRDRLETLPLPWELSCPKLTPTPPGPPYCTYGLRVPAFSYCRECTRGAGQLAPPTSPCTVRTGYTHQLWAYRNHPRTVWCHSRSWPAEKRLLAATQFVRQVWRELHGGDSGAAAAALRAHAESRFEPLRLRPLAAQEGLLAPERQHSASHGSAAWRRGLPPEVGACADAAAATAATRAEVHEHVARGVGALADALRNVSADAGVREITAANYLELLGAFVVGAEHTHAFVRDCCLGGWAPAQGGTGGSGWLEP